MQISQKDIEKFHKFESSNNIQSAQYKNDYIWPVIRFAVFYYIVSEHYVYKSKNNSRKFYKSISRIISSFKSFLYFFGKTDIILFDSARNINIDGHKRHPTTYAFYNTLSKKYSITIIDMHGLVEKKSYPAAQVIDLSFFLAIIRFLSRFFYKKKWNASMDELESRIYSFYNKNVDLHSIFSNVYIYQYALSFFTRIIIKFKKPKIMIYSDNASLSMAIRVAHLKNIITIDYQHSLVSKLNILYSHQKNISSVYKSHLSQIIMTYGTYWKKYYNPLYKVLPVGSLHQEKALRRDENVEKDPNCITIVSGIISREILIGIALYLSKEIPQLKIFYKLRPEEYSSWQQIYPDEIQNCSSVFFIDNEMNELYYYLKKSEYVVGINSTVLIEALPLSKIIIFKHGWYSEMIDFIESQIVLLAQDYSEIARIIKGNVTPVNKIDSNHIYREKVAINISHQISKLLSK